MKKGNWLRLVLSAAFAASVLANVFLVGFVLRGQQEAPAAAILADGIIGTYPPEVRTEFRRVLRESRAEAGAALRDLREARRALSAAANAAPYDPAEVASAMAEVRRATDALQGVVQAVLLEALNTVRAN